MIKQTKSINISNINNYGDHDAAVDLVEAIESVLPELSKNRGTLSLSIHHSQGDRPWESDSYDIELSWEL